MRLARRLGARFKAEFLGRVVAKVSGALLIILLARLLDPDAYGVFFLALSVLGMLRLVSKLGIARSAARYIAEYREKEPGQIPHILRTALGFNLVTITVGGFVLVVAHAWIAQQIGEPRLQTYLLYGVFYLVFGTLLVFVRFVLQGFEAIHLSAVVHMVDRGGKLVFAIGFVLMGYGAIGALVGYTVAVGLAAVLGFAFLYLWYYRTQEAAATVERGLRERMIKYTIPLTATSTADVLDKRIDTILVGFFLNPVAVSFYTVGKQVVGFIETPVSALGFTLSPTFGSEKEAGNVDRLSRIYETALVNSLLLYVPAAAGLVLVADPLIELVFGSDYLGAVPVLQVLGIYLIFRSITKMTSNGLDYLGRARERAIAKGTASVLNVGLNVLLIPLIGVAGAAIATAITSGIYTFANVYIIHAEIGLRIRYLVRRVGHIIAITVIMAGGVFLTLDFIVDWITLGAVVLLGVIIWGGLAVSTGILDVDKIKSVLM